MDILALGTVWYVCDCIDPLFHTLDDWLVCAWAGTDGVETDWTGDDCVATAWIVDGWVLSDWLETEWTGTVWTGTVWLLATWIVWTGSDCVATAWIVDGWVVTDCDETVWTGDDWEEADCVATAWTAEELDDTSEDDWYATDWIAGVAVAFVLEILYVVALVLSAKEFGKAYCENIKSAVNVKKRITLLFMHTLRRWVNKKLWHNVLEQCYWSLGN